MSDLGQQLGRQLRKVPVGSNSGPSPTDPVGVVVKTFKTPAQIRAMLKNSDGTPRYPNAAAGIKGPSDDEAVVAELKRIEKELTEDKPQVAFDHNAPPLGQPRAPFTNKPHAAPQAAVSVLGKRRHPEVPDNLHDMLENVSHASRKKPKPTERVKCAICLTNTPVDIALPCRHEFHQDCIDQMLQFNPRRRCPLCRQDF